MQVKIVPCSSVVPLGGNLLEECDGDFESAAYVIARIDAKSVKNHFIASQTNSGTTERREYNIKETLRSTHEITDIQFAIDIQHSRARLKTERAYACSKALERGKERARE